MNSQMRRILANATLAIAFVLSAVATTDAAIRDDDGACVADATTLSQIKAAQKATARFHSITAAEKAGYTNINLPIPNMGEHWVNFELVDGEFDPEKPEALVYADLGTGQLQLVAVEYLVPLSDTAPEGFVGTCDQWSPFGDVFWTLHAWVWYPNLSGTFAKFNPLILE